MNLVNLFSFGSFHRGITRLPYRPIGVIRPMTLNDAEWLHPEAPDVAAATAKREVEEDWAR